MSWGYDTVTIDVELKDETEKAWLVVSVDTEKEAWVPKSMCKLTLGLVEIDGVLTLPEWMAEEKGLV